MSKITEWWCNWRSCSVTNFGQMECSAFIVDFLCLLSMLLFILSFVLKIVFSFQCLDLGPNGDVLKAFLGHIFSRFWHEVYWRGCFFLNKYTKLFSCQIFQISTCLKNFIWICSDALHSNCMQCVNNIIHKFYL